ncbi:MAG TPA: NAD(+)/NADH kinase, partial [Solirubrobacteraceae bacterium]|nr:NAD(+)/NADH kinase [Solirubrobacteraceae bacterium]
MSVARVMTHRVVDDTDPAFGPLRAAAERAGYSLRFDEEEVRKHGLSEGADETDDDVSLCIVLGGDGTILRALRRFADTDVPVFAMNFGEVGFLATVEPDGMDEGFARAFARNFDVLRLPAVVLSGVDGEKAAINDVSIHRKVGERVAQLAYAIEDAELGSVRCDGLVIA